MMDFTSPLFSAVALDKVFVVYDEATGDVVSTHRVVTARGTPAPTGQELHDRILEFERQNPRRKTAAQFGMLPLPLDAIAPGFVYRVDLGTRQLVVQEDHRAEMGFEVQ